MEAKRIQLSGDAASQMANYVVGLGNVTRIRYHEPQGEGDKHYCDVYINDEIIREFKLDHVVFENPDVLEE